KMGPREAGEVGSLPADERGKNHITDDLVFWVLRDCAALSSRPENGGASHEAGNNSEGGGGHHRNRKDRSPPAALQEVKNDPDAEAERNHGGRQQPPPTWQERERGEGDGEAGKERHIEGLHLLSVASTGCKLLKQRPGNRVVRRLGCNVLAG